MESEKLKAIKPKVLYDLSQGASIKDVSKKYGISVYYAKKWTGLVYKDGTVESIASHRYRWCVNNELPRFEADLAEYLPPTISDSCWNLICGVLKEHMWRLVHEIVKAN